MLHKTLFACLQFFLFPIFLSACQSFPALTPISPSPTLVAATGVANPTAENIPTGSVTNTLVPTVANPTPSRSPVPGAATIAPAQPTVTPTLTVNTPAAPGGPASIGGRVWHDLCESGKEGQPPPASPPAGCVGSAGSGYRANGILEPGEPILAGIRVTLGSGTCPSSGLAETVTTAGSPSYFFRGLNPGTYCVSINPLQAPNSTALLPGGWTFPGVVEGVIGTTVTLRAGENRTDVNFGWDYQFLPVSPTPRNDGTCVYRATFLGDVTIPDNTRLSGGTAFTKTWRVRNDGTCSWGAGGFALHSLAFVGGDRLGAPDTVEFSVQEIKPGSTVDLSVPMIAPNVPGPYRSEWKLRVDNGPLVGVGRNGVLALYAQIYVNVQGPAQTRVSFPAGATSTSVSGNLQAGSTQDFLLSAIQGQTMLLNLSSFTNQARVDVFGTRAGSPRVTRASPDGWYWLGTLPATQDYILRVTGGSQPTDFSLDILIPQRIEFAPGAASGTIRGSTTARRTFTYILRAFAGQTMAINLSPANPEVLALTLYGLDDGQPLARAAGGATAWKGVLTLTQDYILAVVPGVDTPVSYTLLVTIQ